jgi:hypothetical protein
LRRAKRTSDERFMGLPKFHYEEGRGKVRVFLESLV